MIWFIKELKSLKRGDLLRQCVPGLIMAAFAFLSVAAPEFADRVAQEDSWIEWLTFGAFFAAGLVFSLEAKRLGFVRAWVVTAAALFCFAVAGEEISWGQRLYGFLPPEVFLRYNYQQEPNLHNILQPYLQPKWLVLATLVFWGAALPALRAFSSGLRLRLPSKADMMIIPLSFTPWALLGAALLVIYPVDFTGEYIELLTGALFYLAASGQTPSPGRRAALIVLPFFIAASGCGLMELLARTDSDLKISCARNEVRALAKAVACEGATEKLLDKDSFHRRMFTALRSGYLGPGVVKAVEAVPCPGISQDPGRKRYLMDPWGQPYWLRYRAEPGQDSETAVIYSFGPNRRRDSETDNFSGTDDIGVRTSPIQPDAKEQPGSPGDDDAAVLQ